jgi:SAM-dependent methyltransferase
MDHTSTTVNSYDACAHAYDKKFSDFPLYEAPRQEFAELLTDGARILDLGCGPGTMSAYLANLDRAFVLEGFDLSPQMIAMAHRKLPDGRFWIHDLRAPFHLAGPYDALVASFCIVHLNDVETAEFLDRLHPLCKRGSQLYLSWIDGVGGGLETTSFGGEQQFWYCRHDGQRLRSRLEHLNWKMTISGTKSPGQRVWECAPPNNAFERSRWDKVPPSHVGVRAAQRDRYAVRGSLTVVLSGAWLDGRQSQRLRFRGGLVARVAAKEQLLRFAKTLAPVQVCVNISGIVAGLTPRVPGRGHCQGQGRRAFRCPGGALHTIAAPFEVLESSVAEA